jgi:hypothetical protein
MPDPKPMGRDPVVVAPDGQIPADGYQVGDQFFFAISNEFYFFTVIGFDEIFGMRTKNVSIRWGQDRHRKSTGTSESHIESYIERIKTKKPKETIADAAWAATQAAGRP